MPRAEAWAGESPASDCWRSRRFSRVTATRRRVASSSSIVGAGTVAMPTL